VKGRMMSTARRLPTAESFRCSRHSKPQSPTSYRTIRTQAANLNAAYETVPDFSRPRGCPSLP
jgi:hypothetical protein